jgi:putative Holliday junction resolvase
VLGLDYGARRIGLAVSDPEGEFAFPAGVLERRSRERDLEALATLVRERGVQRIVMGLPLHLDGRQGPEAEAVRGFAAALGELTGLPVALLDERWTSREAEHALRATDPRSGRRRRRERRRRGPGQNASAEVQAPAGKGRVDAAAAAIVLRTWLQRERAAGAAP